MPAGNKDGDWNHYVWRDLDINHVHRVYENQDLSAHCKGRRTQRESAGKLSV